MKKSLVLMASLLTLSMLESTSLAAEPPTAEGRQKMALTHHKACKEGEPKACTAFKAIWNGGNYEQGLNMYWQETGFVIAMGQLESAKPPWKVSATLVSLDGKPTYSPTDPGFWAFKTVTVDYPKVIMSGTFGALGEITFEGEVVDPKAEGEAVITGTVKRVKSGKTTTRKVRLETWPGD